MWTRYRIGRRAALKGAAAGLFLAKLPGTVVRAQSLEPFVFQTSWRAQGEHGGYYQAIASGIYARYGIDCTIRAGGPNMSPQQLMMGGRADAIMSNGFQSFHYVNANLPFLTVAGMLQKVPSILMAHPGVGNDSFEQLKGKRILLGAGSATSDSYWAVLRQRFGYTDDQLRPYTFNLGPFLHDDQVIQQAFISTEPYMVRKVGIDPVTLMIADLGIGDYADTIDTSQKMVDENPDLLQRFINASIEGWMKYIKGDELQGAYELIKRNNQDMTDDQMAFARQTFIDRGIVFSGDATTLGIGAMTDERWTTFHNVMKGVGQYRDNFDVRKAYTLKFVNKRVGLA
jgi:NitT/TauT family transport system substrate-binding protein